MSNLSIDKYPDWVLNNPKVEISGNSIRLYHYGDTEGTGVLDPKFFGKNPYTSDVKQWDKPRVMFYISPLDKENRVMGKQYIVDYPLDKLYPFNSDPNYYYEECAKDYDNPNLSVGIQLDCISTKAEQDGFDGMILKWQSTLRVDIWKSVKVNEPVNNNESMIRDIVKNKINESFINESGFSRLKNIMNGQVDSVNTIAIITAENPQGKQLPAEENNKLNNEFKSLLKNGNYGYVQIKGKFGNVENPFFIMNIRREDAIKYGKDFDQQSIIFGSKNKDGDNIGFTFEYIEGSNTIQKRYVSLSGEDVKNRSDFYSNYKGRKFLIPFFDDEYENKSLSNGVIKNVNNESIDKKIYDDIIKRVNYITESKSTGFSLWANRGVIKEILSKNNASFFD